MLLSRYLNACVQAVFVGGTLVGGAVLWGAEVEHIPDSPRSWTFRDWRVKPLCFVERDGNVVVFQDVARSQTYRVGFDDLSHADQSYLRSIDQDGSRLWVHRDGRGRRLRLVQCDGVTALFDIPNVGLGTTLVRDLSEADQKFVAKLVQTMPATATREFSVALIVQPADSAASAPASDAVRDAVVEAFENAELSAELAAIGSGASFRASADGDWRFVVELTLAQLAVTEAKANAKLAGLNEKLLPQVTQILNIKETNAPRFKLSLKLDLVRTPDEPVDGGSSIDDSVQSDCCQVMRCDAFYSCRPDRQINLLQVFPCRRCCLVGDHVFERFKTVLPHSW